jgi:hypothetical protein
MIFLDSDLFPQPPVHRGLGSAGVRIEGILKRRVDSLREKAQAVALPR